MRFVVACVLATAFAGCGEPRFVDCGDYSCPSGYRCLDVGGCASPEDDAACPAGASDGTACATGFCRDGACISPACGNRIVEPEAGEVCDDGNSEVGDGCSAGCRSNETCGNRVADTVATGEDCDCGTGSGELPSYCKGQSNSNSSVDAVCREDCKFARCGDGIVDNQDECEGTVAMNTTCADLGYYRGARPGCSKTCELVPACTDCCSDSDEVDGMCCAGRCGDLVVDTDFEFCDGVVPTSCTTFGFDYGRPACTSICSASFAPCEVIGWQDVLGVGSRAIWGSSSTDVYVSGTAGIQHFNGTLWRVEDTGVPESMAITSISGSSADDVWFLSSRTVLRRTPTSWTRHDLAPLVPPYDVGVPRSLSLSDIVAVAPNRVFAVGVASHEELNDLCPIEPGSPPPPCPPTITVSEGVVFEYDGVWHPPTFMTYPLSAVWASRTSSLVIAVGGSSIATNATGTNATGTNATGTWQQQSVAPSSFSDVWGANDSNIFIVGYHLGTAEALHYTGTGPVNNLSSWSPTWPAPSQKPIALWGTSSSDVLAVVDGLGGGSIFQYDGAKWLPTQEPPQGATGVWGHGGVAYLTGALLRRSTLLWADARALAPGSGTIHTIADGFPSAWVHGYAPTWELRHRGRLVGSPSGLAGIPDILSFDGDTAYVASQGSIYRFDSATNQLVAEESTGAVMLSLLDGTSSDNIVAIGQGPMGVAIFERSAAGWSEVDTTGLGGYVNLVRVFGIDAIAVGPGPAPTVLRRSSSGWVEEHPAELVGFVPQSLHGNSASDLTLIGERDSKPAFARFSNGVWTVSDVPGVTFLAVAASRSSTEVYVSAVTTTGARKLLVYDGDGWIDVASPDPLNLMVIMERTASGLYVGRNSYLWRLSRPFGHL
ncbi:MAG: hypothetical protein ACKV2T_43970 [Kofleriaceae bacterium]